MAVMLFFLEENLNKNHTFLLRYLWAFYLYEQNSGAECGNNTYTIDREDNYTVYYFISFLGHIQYHMNIFGVGIEGCWVHLPKIIHSNFHCENSVLNNFAFKSYQHFLMLWNSLTKIVQDN